MKAKIYSMVMLMALVLSLGFSAEAATKNDVSIQWDTSYQCSPVLSFSGNTATCSVVIRSSESSAKITASMVLYRVSSDGSLIRAANWSLSGTGQISASRTYPYAVSGATYRLVVTGTVTDSTGSHPVSAYRQAKCP